MGKNILLRENYTAMAELQSLLQKAIYAARRKTVSPEAARAIHAHAAQLLDMIEAAESDLPEARWCAENTDLPQGLTKNLSFLGGRITDFKKDRRIDAFLNLRKVNGRWACDSLRFLAMRHARASGFTATREECLAEGMKSFR